MQIDIVNPLDRGKRQTTPKRGERYENQLAFRIKFDNSMNEAHKAQIKKKIKTEEVKIVPNQYLIRSTILTCQRQPDLYDPSKLKMNLNSAGMPEFNKSQR